MLAKGCVDQGGDSLLHQPSERDQIVSFDFIDLCHTLPDSGERQYKSRT